MPDTKGHTCMISFVYKTSRIGSYIQTENILGVVQGWREGTLGSEWIFSAYEVSFWNNKSVLELDSDAGCNVLNTIELYMLKLLKWWMLLHEFYLIKNIHAHTCPYSQIHKYFFCD